MSDTPPKANIDQEMDSSEKLDALIKENVQKGGFYIDTDNDGEDTLYLSATITLSQWKRLDQYMKGEGDNYSLTVVIAKENKWMVPDWDHLENQFKEVRQILNVIKNAAKQTEK